MTRFEPSEHQCIDAPLLHKQPKQKEENHERRHNPPYPLDIAHPHMLRHACGFALANKGHDTRALQAYLGYRNIQHTVRYTELSPNRFQNFWR